MSGLMSGGEFIGIELMEGIELSRVYPFRIKWYTAILNVRVVVNFEELKQNVEIYFLYKFHR